jgi:hypothetical protein
MGTGVSGRRGGCGGERDADAVDLRYNRSKHTLEGYFTHARTRKEETTGIMRTLPTTWA